jgi:alpha-N-acetylglucosamine transferase
MSVSIHLRHRRGQRRTLRGSISLSRLLGLVIASTLLGGGAMISLLQEARITFADIVAPHVKARQHETSFIQIATNVRPQLDRNNVTSNYGSLEVSNGPCQNPDFRPNNTIAIVTLNTGGDTYLEASIALALSIQRGGTKVPVDLVILELATKPLSSFDELQRVGWKRCVVEAIQAPRTPAKQFVDQFAKLHLWNMASYHEIIYIDSDTMVLGSLNELIELKIPSQYPMAATKDFERGRWINTFNLGVFKIYPNRTEFDRLTAIRLSDSIEYNANMCEQAWLNKVYPNWFDFGLANNFNFAAIHSNELPIDLSLQILHFTSPKPWDKKCLRPYQRKKEVSSFCRQWKSLIRNYRSGREGTQIVIANQTNRISSLP